MLSRPGIAATVGGVAALIAFAFWPKGGDSVEVRTDFPASGGIARATPPPISFTVPAPQQNGLLAEDLPPPLDPPPSCDVTAPTGGTPPGQYRDYPNVFSENGQFVGLSPGGTVVFRAGGAGSVEPDGSLGMKFWWWRPAKGADLEIAGRRLDAPAAALMAEVTDGYDDQEFVPAGLIFPTQGCWEVTGRVGDATLTFVTLVLVKP
jgi:hypothetical protein